MVKLTKCAAKEIIKKMCEEGLLKYGLRVAIVGGGLNGFEYTLSFNEKPSDNDMVFESNGVKIFVDPTSYIYLQGTTIDFVKKENMEGFIFHNPKPVSLLEKESKDLN